MNPLSPLVFVTMLAFPLVGIAQTLFSDDLNSDTSADYTILTASNDTNVDFEFDYSALGIPAAPNTTDGSTLGLRMAANLTQGVTSAVTLATNMQFSGSYTLQFDAWINVNGPFPAGGGGSTEFLTAGVGSDAATINFDGTSGSGAWVSASGDGGSGSDYRIYKDASLQSVASGQYVSGRNNTDPLFSGFGSVDVGAIPIQNAIPQQTGSTQAGSFGMEWHRVMLMVDATGGTDGTASITWAIDGLDVATIDAGNVDTVSTDGSVTIGYMDIFSSLSDNSELSFGLIDNVLVEVAQVATVRATAGEFGIVNADGAMSSATYSVENRSGEEIMLTEVNFSGNDAASFALASVIPMVIEVGETVDVEITFTASGETGTKTGSVEFVTTDAQTPSVSLALSATYAAQLLAHYRLDETSGTAVVESSGNSLNGAFVIRSNSLSYAQEGLATGTSIGFTGADASDAGSFALLRPLHVPTFSISMWIKPSVGNGGDDTLFNRDPDFSGGDKIYGCALDDNGVLTYRSGREVTLQSLTGAIVDDTAYHVVITHLDEDGFGNTSATRARMFINGAMVAENTAPIGFDVYPSTAPAGVGSLYIASRTAAGFGYDGLIDDIQVYSIEITPAQIANMFNVPGVTAFDTIPEVSITKVVHDADSGDVTITWDSLPGAGYLLEESINLTTWVELDDSLVGDGFETTLTFTPSAGGDRFFRLVEIE